MALTDPTGLSPFLFQPQERDRPMKDSHPPHLDPEDQFLQLLYLMVLYLRGGEAHSPYLADPYPDRPNSRSWHTTETFTHLESYLKPDWDTLNALEAAGWIEQPQKFKKWHQQNYVCVTKTGMQTARELLQSLPLEGVEAALNARSRHQDYIAHKNRIDLRKEQDEESDGIDSEE